MNLSLNWVNDYVKTDGINVDELADGLTMSGSKAEKYKDLSDPLSNVVIGRVSEIKRHENSDKLWICQVDVGNSAENSSVQIITGAQNVSEGAIVPVVLDGGVVFNHKDKSVTKIKKGKLRGEVSEGMLCGKDELGFEPDGVDGIWILNGENGLDGIEKAALGSCFLEFAGLKDTVIEFEITNNRADCMSVTGLAREIAATFELPLNIPNPAFKGNADGDINKELTVMVDNKQKCSRYMAGLVKNVKIAPSPQWLCARLKAHDIRPINNIVDITNYVMLEYGNPLHAFDKRFVEGNTITVRDAKENEKITLLDGNTVTLDNSILVIADASKPIAVAGVMGGEYSGVMDDTETVVFEAACFDGVSVRRAAKKIGRRTESSSRFEKGLNPVNTETALLRALQLVEELGCGDVCNTIIDEYVAEAKTVTVSHDYDAINKFLGTDIPEKEQVGIFRKLGFGYEDGKVIVPHTRSDINLQCDLAEEVARIYGYDKIGSTLPRLSNSGKSNPKERATQKLVNALTAQGCRECITYSFVPAKTASENAVKIRNPFGEETSVMRTSMYPSMLKVIANNLNSRNTEGRLFEIGRVYQPGKETDTLCIGLYGKDEDFYTLKGIIEEIAERFKINLEDLNLSRHTEPPFHPGRGASFDCGVFGEINPIVSEEYGISGNERVYIAEINVEKLSELSANADSENGKYTPVPKYPASVRDLSFVCGAETESGTIVKIINNSGGKLLADVEFFDMFEGGNLGQSEKSLSYKLTFRKPDGTLTDGEVDDSVKKILGKLAENNIKLRS